MSSLIRFFALLRLNLLPACAGPRQPSFNLAASPGGLLVVRQLRHRGSIPLPSNQRLRCGLPGYLICSLPTLSHLSVSCQPEGRLRHRCSSNIYTFTAPLDSLSPLTLKIYGLDDCRVEPRYFTSNLLPPVPFTQIRITLATYVLPRLLA